MFSLLPLKNKILKYICIEFENKEQTKPKHNQPTKTTPKPPKLPNLDFFSIFILFINPQV